ncbi:hypothetical protein M9Y10_016187 [Tritrichomonas musculus]|uniref:Uncharacterized protein n=1 Tax=Tritrichomonas musculus TaxID=1915356 RepID=A0ABR2I6B8_9EUKA
MITRNGEINDVEINCLYTKSEVDEQIRRIESNPANSYFELKESDQLYLYKPSSISQSDKYYEMTWNIDSNYNIPLQTNFEFRDYLFGHTWSLIWDGNSWTGNNVVNRSIAKQSTTTNNNGSPALVVQHTDYISKWLRCEVELNDSNVNYATTLSSYVNNWRVAYKDGAIIELNESNSVVKLDSASQYDNLDVQQFSVKVNNISGNNMLYVLADLNINGHITPLKWDLHPISPLSMKYLHTWNDNPVIESFTYVREVTHSKKSICETNSAMQIPEENPTKDIHIYIEKEYFEQKPANADETYNPFDVMIVQQFYEVKPDPRNCTTLTTDNNIYSSKIIWADNIMTMRRDLNVVGGTVDVLAYDYSVLHAIINGIQEQLRLQAAYNEYTDSIRKGLAIAGDILNILTGAVKMMSDLSTLSLSGENMKLNTYRTEDFTFPGMGGPNDDYPGGKPPISGQFILDMDTSAAGQVLKRFIPTDTEIPAATSSLTATDLVLNALNSLTQIGTTTTTLIAGGLTLNRIPEMIQGVQTISQSIHTITDSVRELRRRWRERSNNTIVDHSIENTDEMDLDDRVETPITRLTHDTTTNASTSNTVFGNYTLESLSNLTNEQLLALNSDNIIVEQIGSNQVGVITITYIHPNGSRELVYIRRCDNVRSIISPEHIRLYSQQRIDTTSKWTYDNRTALEIEQMLPVDRILFENTHTELRFIRNSDADSGVNWTEVRDENNSTVAIIDVSIAVRTSVGTDGISIHKANPAHESNVNINSDGIHIEDSTRELVANEYNVVVVNHEPTPTTDADVIIPGTTITLRDIEQMDWFERHRLTNEIHALRFRPHDPDSAHDNEEYTEVVYSNNVIGVIDRRHLNQVTINDNQITITNPDNSLVLTDHDIQWMRDHDEQQRSSLSGFISNIRNRLEEINMDVEWLLEHPSLTDRYVVCRGSRILVPIVDAVLYIPRAIRGANTCETRSGTQTAREIEGESIPTKISLQPLIDWCTSTESDISLPDDNNEAVSLNSCVNICNTFRDTVKGPLALLSYKIQEVEKYQSSSTEATNEFDTVDGYPSYYVKHQDLTVYEPTSTDSVQDPVVIMKITLPSVLKNKLLACTTKTELFKIHMRNLLIMDWLGNILNDFTISVVNGKFICPELTHNKARDCYTYSTRERDDPEIMFDKDLDIEPYSWYLRGDMTIHNLLNDDSLVARKPVIKCDVIDAENALRLQKSDVYYFYRPTMITYDEHVKYADTFGTETLEYECDLRNTVLVIVGR